MTLDGIVMNFHKQYTTDINLTDTIVASYSVDGAQRKARKRNF